MIDAVFSLGIKYQTTEKVVKRIATHFKTPLTRGSDLPMREEQLSVTAFISGFNELGVEKMTADVFGNRNLTSPTNGILKSEAVLQFCLVLQNFQVDYLQDISVILNRPDFEKAIQVIPGQGTGISLKYFYMLTGSDELIKPDRMIFRFIKSALWRTVDIQECQKLLEAVCELLSATYPKLTLKQLDYGIWQYQRSISSI
ncbi:MAG: hypothetical protein SGI73_07515 [Chloroflexota bacterium]|nr:hypothetical protein [Chloroflexota bacterium]